MIIFVMMIFTLFCFQFIRSPYRYMGFHHNHGPYRRIGPHIGPHLGPHMRGGIGHGMMGHGLHQTHSGKVNKN